MEDMLRHQFNMFNHIVGESLDKKFQRFTTLVTQFNLVGVVLTKYDINNKLLISLPKEWDVDVAVLKKTRNLSILTLAEVIAILKSCDMDNKQREINHVNSYATANLTISSNNAYHAQPVHYTPPPTYYSPISAGSSTQ